MLLDFLLDGWPWLFALIVVIVLIMWQKAWDSKFWIKAIVVMVMYPVLYLDVLLYLCDVSIDHFESQFLAYVLFIVQSLFYFLNSKF